MFHWKILELLTREEERRGEKTPSCRKTYTEWNSKYCTWRTEGKMEERREEMEESRRAERRQ